jgi:uncharacterized protein (TIGR00269 family)
MCEEKAVVAIEKSFCKKHFNKHFEKKVAATIKKYNLLNKKEKIVVACSGGKDSTVLLCLLKKFGYNVTALAIDEGIRGYRGKTLKELKHFCNKNEVHLKIYSYKKYFGTSLDAAFKKNIPRCRVCGVWRRYLLNHFSKGFDKLVTGHNMDDEAQSIMMNLVKGNAGLSARLGPITGILQDSHFVSRVKPLYFCSEKEIASYAFLNCMNTSFIECPYASTSFRSKIRDLLNGFETKHQGSKRRLVENFVKQLPLLKSHYSGALLKYCTICNYPCSSSICNACRYKQQLATQR